MVYEWNKLALRVLNIYKNHWSTHWRIVILSRIICACTFYQGSNPKYKIMNTKANLAKCNYLKMDFKSILILSRLNFKKDVFISFEMSHGFQVHFNEWLF